MLEQTLKEIIHIDQRKEELLYDPKIRNSFMLGNSIKSIRAVKKPGDPFRVGFTNGKFLIPHVGHHIFLSLARAQCDLLVVGINSDYSLRVLGKKSPFSDKERAFMLSSLSVVDYVCLFDEETPFNCISAVNPDFVIKGYEYENETVISAGKTVKVIKHNYTDIHSSDLLKHETKAELKFFDLGELDEN